MNHHPIPVVQSNGPCVVDVVPFRNSNGAGVASVHIGCGPLLVKAILYKGERGFFLGMPGRKNEEDNKWFNYAEIQDYSVKKQLLDLAVQEFRGREREMMSIN